jgi:hypothetical protein
MLASLANATSDGCGFLSNTFSRVCRTLGALEEDGANAVDIVEPEDVDGFVDVAGARCADGPAVCAGIDGAAFRGGVSDAHFHEGLPSWEALALCGGSAVDRSCGEDGASACGGMQRDWITRDCVEL